MNALKSNRSSKGKFADDEELSALIDDFDQDEKPRFVGIRQRQSPSKTKAIQESNLTSSLIDDDQIELRNIEVNHHNNDSTKELFEYTYYDLQPTDTLQSICLRYACPVNRVKRLNGLMNDQDFYGLAKIKLPLGKLGLLQDVIHQTDDHHEQTDKFANLTRTSSPRPKLINSPGSALSIGVSPRSSYKPLLCPGLSSDQLDQHSDSGLKPSAFQNGPGFQHNHSLSFSSLRDFADDNINIDISLSSNTHKSPNPRPSYSNFIKSDLDNNTDVDDLIMVGRDTMGKVFQDLDYHVEKVKMSARNYDKRATELVNRIDNGQSPADWALNQRNGGSKIPQLFHCNETFGLNYKKLVALIFIVCIVVPLVYINQSAVVTTQL